MKKYTIIKSLAARLFTSILLLYLLVTFLFFLLRMAPGDPAGKYLAPELSPELNKAIREEFRLDQPVFEQYYFFISNMFQGNFGTSFIYRRPVLDVLFEFIPFTIILSLIAMVFQIFGGYYAAKYVFRKDKMGLDRKASALSLLIYSAPTFVTGILLILIFSETLNLLPSSGVSSYYHQDPGFFAIALDYIKHLILPVITLSIGGAALFYTYFRENLSEVSGKLFVVNLRANGFSEREIIKHHIVPNSLTPVISAASVEFGILLGGALITEVIFSLPGMGRLTVNAIFTRDYPLIIGCSFFAGCMIILAGIAGDLIKARLDPRMLAAGVLN